MTDERCIWQGSFTAIGTQSVSYTEMEKGKENGSIPKDEYGNDMIARKNNMGYIMNLYENRTEIQRISLSKDENYKEPWVIDIPVDISTFRYDTEKRKKESVAPVFEGEVGGGIVNQIKFKQAVHSDLVHSYRIILDNGTESKELLYFSDFFLMQEDRR